MPGQPPITVLRLISGYGQKPQASNASALGGYKQGGNARTDANRGKQSMGGGGSGRFARSRPAGGGARKR